MSGTKYIASNWRIPENSNSSKNDNYSLSYDGTEYFTINSSTQLDETPLNPYSISFWIKTTNSSSSRVISEKRATSTFTDAQYTVHLQSGSVFWYGGAGGNGSILSTSSPINDGEWHHIVLVAESTISSKMYVDGQLDGTSSGNRINSSSVAGTFNIGSNYTGSFLFIGDLSEYSIFDYALSDPQIESLAGRAQTGAGNPMALKPTPVAYYPLGDNSSGGIDVGPTSILTQPNASVDDASVFYMNPLGIEVSSKLGFQDGTNAFSGAAWVNIGAGVNATTMSRQRGRLANGTYPGWHFGTTGSGAAQGDPEFEIRGNDPSQGWLRVKCLSYTLQDDLWHFIAFTYDGSLDASGVKLYVDGYEDTLRQVLVNTFTGTTTDYNTPFVVGGGYHNFGNTRFGSNQNMSNAMYFESELSAADILTLYNDGIPLNDLTSFTSLKAIWKLDQSANWDVGGSGNWTIPDASGNGNDGTSSGMTSGNLVLSDLTRNLPYENYSLNFDGTETVLCQSDLAGNLNQIDGAISVSCWVKTTQGAVYENMVTRDAFGGADRDWSLIKDNFYPTAASGGAPLWQLWNTNSDVLQIRLTSANDPAGNPIIPINDGNWHHIVGVYDGSDTAYLYTDGVLQGTTTVVGFGSFPLRKTRRVCIGGFNNGSLPTALVGSWTGGISNTAIWDIALSSTEVLKLHANGLPQDLTNFTLQPMSWYPMGKQNFWDGSDWIVTDPIGSNDGTSTNMTVSDLVGDAPRSENNGTGTNMDIPTNLVGNAGFSDKNAYSINMGPSSRVTDTP